MAEKTEAQLVAEQAAFAHTVNSVKVSPLYESNVVRDGEYYIVNGVRLTKVEYDDPAFKARTGGR